MGCQLRHPLRCHVPRRMIFDNGLFSGQSDTDYPVGTRYDFSNCRSGSVAAAFHAL